MGKKTRLTPPFLNLSNHLFIERAGLTRPKYNAKILNLSLRERDLNLAGSALFNSLEIVTAKLYPQVRQVKDKLRDMGVKSIVMSGSGPAMVGIVPSRKEAVSLKAQLKADSNSWQVFAVKTV